VKNAATQIEVYYTENGSYPDTTWATANLRWSENVSATYNTTTAPYVLSADALAGDGTTVICTAEWDPSAGTFAAASTC